MFTEILQTTFEYLKLEDSLHSFMNTTSIQNYVKIVVFS